MILEAPEITLGMRDIRVADPATLAPEGGRQRRGHDNVERRENEQRHRVEQHRLVLAVHLGDLMVNRAALQRWAVRPIGNEGVGR